MQDRPSGSEELGIHACPPGAGDDLLSTDALQCWFDAPNGRWRTLSHESHFAVLVVNVEANDLNDAESIARRFVASERQTFEEILVYVRAESTDGEKVRRIRWTAQSGFETLEFSAPAAVNNR
jgi:hypothetical protein